jgi:hypothetical protein
MWAHILHMAARKLVWLIHQLFHFHQLPCVLAPIGKLNRYNDLLQAGWSRNRIPVGGEMFCTCTGWSRGPPSLPYNGYQNNPTHEMARA